jgi:hypothetical protein
MFLKEKNGFKVCRTPEGISVARGEFFKRIFAPTEKLAPIQCWIWLCLRQWEKLEPRRKVGAYPMLDLAVCAYRKVGTYGKFGALPLPRHELTPTLV